MKLRVIATLVAVLAFSAASASAQYIGVFTDLCSSSCNVTAAPFTVENFYINVVRSDVLPTGGIAGAEFQVVHDFEPGTLLTPTANAASNVALGNPMTGGCDIAFPGCQVGDSVNLYSVQLVFLQAGNTTATMAVVAHTTPSSPNFACSLVWLCDDPVFTVVCVAGTEAFVNIPTYGCGVEDCTLAVEDVSWGAVKSLFN